MSRKFGTDTHGQSTAVLFQDILAHEHFLGMTYLCILFQEHQGRSTKENI